jgi:hypothetical protein
MVGLGFASILFSIAFAIVVLTIMLSLDAIRRW